MMKILVPVDFEPQSLIAMEQSYNLARLLPAEIVLLFVYDAPAGIRSLFGANYDEEILKKIEDKLKGLASTVQAETGLKVSTLLETGRIYSKILETAEKIEAQFIIMGTHSQPELPEKTTGVLGANSSRVLRSAKCPVITINARHHYNGCRNIMLPLDLTAESRQKVSWAICIASVYGAGIRVVTGLWKTNDPADRNRLLFMAEQVKSIIEKDRVKCTVEVITGLENERALIPALLDYAEKQGDIDLVMIMTQQETGVIEYFLGSRAQEFVRLSPIPVMSIAPKELGFTSIFS